MTHVGIAVCPACHARFAVAPHTVGLTRACPTCGNLFRVQPIAPAAPPAPFTPPKVDLAAGAPPPPAARVLTPTIYPYRSWIPQGGALAAIVVGVLIVLILVLGIGGKIAYDSVMASLPITKDGAKSNGSGSKSVSRGDSGTNLVGRLAEAASALSPSNLLPDTHASCTAEREKLDEEARLLADRFREQGTPSEESGKELIDLMLRMEDLALRWHKLGPMTESERQTFLEREKTNARATFDRSGGNPSALGMNFDASLAAMMLLLEAEVHLGQVNDMALNPTAPPSGTAEEQYEEVCRACHRACERIFAIRGPRDVDEVQSAANREIAKINAAAEQLRPLVSSDMPAVQAAHRKYAARLQHEQGMAQLAARHVVMRYSMKEAGGIQQDRVVDPVLAQRLGDFASSVKDLTTAMDDAVTGFTPSGLDSAATIAATERQPRVFVPQVGGFGPDPDVERAPRVAEARQSFVERFGPQGFVQIDNRGNSGEWERIQAKMQQLSQTANFASHGFDTRLVGFIHYSGDLDKLAERIDWGQVVRTDRGQRIIEVEVR